MRTCPQPPRPPAAAGRRAACCRPQRLGLAGRRLSDLRRPALAHNPVLSTAAAVRLGTAGHRRAAAAAAAAAGGAHASAARLRHSVRGGQRRRRCAGSRHPLTSSRRRVVRCKKPKHQRGIALVSVILGTSVGVDELWEGSGELYVVMISLHGLVRGQNMELGRDADTGGQARQESRRRTTPGRCRAPTMPLCLPMTRR